MKTPRREGSTALHALLLTLCLSLALCSCGFLNRPRSLFGGKLPVQVVIPPNVNEDSPVAVDLVLIQKKKLIDKILEKSAREWFGGREQFRRDFPGGYSVASWEWIPGQEVPLLEVPVKRGTKTGIVFVDLFTPGQHRVRIDPRKPLRLEISAASFTAEEAP